MNTFPLFNNTLYFPSLFKYSKYFINTIEKYDGVSYILHEPAGSYRDKPI